jgi:hypothetical protein
MKPAPCGLTAAHILVYSLGYLVFFALPDWYPDESLGLYFVKVAVEMGVQAVSVWLGLLYEVEVSGASHRYSLFGLESAELVSEVISYQFVEETFVHMLRSAYQFNLWIWRVSITIWDPVEAISILLSDLSGTDSDAFLVCSKLVSFLGKVVWLLWLLNLGRSRSQSKGRRLDLTAHMVVACSTPGYFVLILSELSTVVRVCVEKIQRSSKDELGVDDSQSKIIRIERAAQAARQAMLGIYRNKDWPNCTRGCVIRSFRVYAAGRVLSRSYVDGFNVYYRRTRHIGWYAAAYVGTRIFAGDMGTGFNVDSRHLQENLKSIAESATLSALAVLTVAAIAFPQAMRDVLRLRVRLLDMKNIKPTSYKFGRYEDECMAALRCCNAKKYWRPGTGCFSPWDVTREDSLARAVIKGSVLMELNTTERPLFVDDTELSWCSAHMRENGNRNLAETDVVGGQTVGPTVRIRSGLPPSMWTGGDRGSASWAWPERVQDRLDKYRVDLTSNHTRYSYGDLEARAAVVEG